MFILLILLAAQRRARKRRGARHTEFEPRGTAGCIPGSWPDWIMTG